MCGLLVFIAKNKEILPNIKKFEESLHLQDHRGPDNCSMLTVENANAYMGFVRLPIIDDHPRSNQPIFFEDIILTFTGELFNYLEILNELKKDGLSKNLHGDTQVFAAAISFWGVEKSLKKFRGMYSAVYYNKIDKNFHVIRDRIGIKPLFVYEDNEKIIYSSEIKCIQYLEKKCLDEDISTVNNFINIGQLDSTDNTFFKKVKRFPRATYTKINKDNLSKSSEKYWELKNRKIRFNKDDLRKIFLDSVNIHFRSDFKIGLALSSGLDSTSIAAAAVHNNIKFDSYTSTHKNNIEEISLVDITARKLNINNIKVSPENVQNLHTIDFLIHHLDQPFKSSGTLNQFSIHKKMLEDGCRVIITGGAADEILAGYTKCLPFYFADLIKNGRLIFLTKQIFGLKEFTNKSYFSNFKDLISKTFPILLKKTTWSKDGALKNYIKYRIFDEPLPYWLRVEDSFSMSISVETRLPFLDHKFIEYVYSLPVEDFFKKYNKNYLRESLDNLIPNEIKNVKKKVQRPVDDSIIVFDKLSEDFQLILNNLSENDINLFTKDILNKDALQLPSNNFKNIFSQNKTPTKKDIVKEYLENKKNNRNERFWMRLFIYLRWKDKLNKRKKNNWLHKETL